MAKLFIWWYPQLALRAQLMLGSLIQGVSGAAKLNQTPMTQGLCLGPPPPSPACGCCSPPRLFSQMSLTATGHCHSATSQPANTCAPVWLPTRSTLGRQNMLVRLWSATEVSKIQKLLGKISTGVPNTLSLVLRWINFKNRIAFQYFWFNIQLSFEIHLPGEKKRDRSLANPIQWK
jgi:hypothetical protein